MTSSAPAPPSTSALYVGHVTHTRLAPTRHRFRYRIAFLYLDLDELERAPGPFHGRWLWSVGRPNVAAFRREDYLGAPEVPLSAAVRARAREVLGAAPEGPVRILTHPRTFGYCFNPVSFYYLFEADGVTLGAVVAEITNTPWGERHSYVLGSNGAVGSNGLVEWRFAKGFHVSPFFDMTQDYTWRFNVPGADLLVGMENAEDQGGPGGPQKVFEVGLTLARRPLNGRSLARFLARHPFTSGGVQLAIHWQALRLWLKRTPVFTHPAKRGHADARL
ncbi:MAG: DUF1365 domain-containing protein [Planctomycetota bacterium]